MMEKPIKILLFADTHLGFDLPLQPRIERRRRGDDFFANYQLILDFARRKQVDLIVHGGDLFFRSKVPPAIVERAYASLFEIASAGIPIMIVVITPMCSSLPPTWMIMAGMRTAGACTDRGCQDVVH